MQPHLKHVPTYLKRGGIAAAATANLEREGESSEIGFVPFKKPGSQRGRGRGRGRGGHRGGKRKVDPLKKGGR